MVGKLCIMLLINFVVNVFVLDVEDFVYILCEMVDDFGVVCLFDVIYEIFCLQVIDIFGVVLYLIKLVQLVVMVLVVFLKFFYCLKFFVVVLCDGLLFDVQFEIVIYVGEVYGVYFVGLWIVDEIGDMVLVVFVDVVDVVCFCCGFFFGDGIGVGKGCQLVGIVFENWV